MGESRRSRTKFVDEKQLWHVLPRCAESPRGTPPTRFSFSARLGRGHDYLISRDERDEGRSRPISAAHFEPHLHAEKCHAVL